jgi:hypothetical protein
MSKTFTVACKDAAVNSAAIDTESAGSADRAGSSYGSVNSGSGNHGPT